MHYRQQIVELVLLIGGQAGEIDARRRDFAGDDLGHLPALAPEFAGPEGFENECDSLPVLQLFQYHQAGMHAVGDGLVHLHLELPVGGHLAADRLNLDLGIIGDVRQRHAEFESVDDFFVGIGIE
jgi:hypothetical protein